MSHAHPSGEADLLADQWERNATEDPLWVILSDPRRGGRRWSTEEFFATGEVEWTRVRDMLERVGAVPDRQGRFVDFGCGVGRVTRQLAREFASGVGIDVSDVMVMTARRLSPGIEFVVNTAPDLALVPQESIQFVYSHIVLQHITPDLQRSFVTEFLRILAPGGVAAFQVVTERVGPPAPIWRRFAVALPHPAKAALKQLLRRPVVSSRVALEMHLVSDADIQTILDANGAHVLAAPYSNSADRDHNGALRFFDRDEAVRRVAEERSASPILSRFYVVRRSGAAATPGA